MSKEKWENMIKRIKSTPDESDEALDDRYFTGLENFFLSQKSLLTSYFIFSQGCNEILGYEGDDDYDSPFTKPEIHTALDAILTEFEKWIYEIFWEQISDMGIEIYPKRKFPDQALKDALVKIIKNNKKLGDEDDARD